MSSEGSLAIRDLGHWAAGVKMLLCPLFPHSFPQYSKERHLFSEVERLVYGKEMKMKTHE